ncbi:MAG: hypothetical protein IJY61_04270 [Candidatus Gastranaerophilales bacterium]|nr:hypothetical protein [Candidatus Gastranaerophilales bacterium]
MNISPVSFRSTTTTAKVDINTLVSKPQAYQKKEEPQAAGPINGTEKKKSPVKTVLGLAVAAGAVMAGLALGAKHGVFNVKEGGNQILETIKKGAKVAGDKILGWGNSAINFVQTKWGEIKNHLPKGEEVVDVAEDIVEEVIEEAPEFVS